MHGAQALLRIEIARRVLQAQLAGDVGEHDDRELEALRLVDGHQPHAFAALFEDRRLRRFGAARGVVQRVDETAKRQAAFGLVAPREVGNVQHVGEHLLAAAPQDEPGVRARRGDQPADRVGDRPMISRGVQLAKRRQRFRDGLEPIGQLAGDAIRMERARQRVIFEQLLFADGEQRSVQRRIHRQFVFGPFDRGQRRANGIHFLALVERLAADEQVRNAARFERLDVVARDVVAEMHEAAEQQADIAGARSSGGSRPRRPSTRTRATASTRRRRRRPPAALR